MKFWLLPFTFVIISYSSYAEETLTISKDDCLKLQNQKSITQSAEYVAGRDVYGRDVVSADVNTDNAIQIPETLEISVDIANRFGLNLKDKGIDLGKIDGGFVSLKENKVFIGKSAANKKEKMAITEACIAILQETDTNKKDENQ